VTEKFGFITAYTWFKSYIANRAGGRTPRTPRPGGGGGSRLTGASCYVTCEFFF